MLRRLFCFAGVLALTLKGSGVQAQYEEAWDEPPRRRAAQPPVSSDGGFMSTALRTLGAALGVALFRRLIWRPWGERRRKKKLQKILKAGVRAIEKDPDILNLQLNIAENERMLDSTLEVAREWEKRLYALPDRNADGRISRPEFDDYMARYKRMHTELRDSDLPRWEEMDTDRTGFITFQEWLDYMDRIRRQRAAMDAYGY